jgi:hypothetical protein
MGTQEKIRKTIAIVFLVLGIMPMLPIGWDHHSQLWEFAVVLWLGSGRSEDPAGNLGIISALLLVGGSLLYFQRD